MGSFWREGIPGCEGAVLPFCYQPSRFGSVTHIQVIWFASLYVRYLHKDGKYDIRSMGDFVYSEAVRTSSGILKVEDDFWCVNKSVSVQSIEVLMKWIARSSLLPESWLWSCLEGCSLDFFLLKIRYTSYVLHLLMGIQFKARSSSKQTPLKSLHSVPSQLYKSILTGPHHS